MDPLLLEIAGLLKFLAEGIHPPNLREQAGDLLEKVGRRLSEQAKSEQE